MAKRQAYRSATVDNRRWDAFVPRVGDIFICTPPKCGTTWMQTIVSSLLWPGGDAPTPIMTVSPWFDATFDPLGDIVQRLDAQEHRRCIKTHTPADGIPWFATGHYIFVGRDGRDAFMSMCNHMEHFRPDVRAELNAVAAAEGVREMPAWTGDVHQFFAGWLASGGVLHDVATFWARRKQPNLLLVHFNDLKADLAAEMQRVAAFLNIEVPDALWPDVVDRCTFSRMRERATEIGTFERRFVGGADTFLFRGTNGRWRDVLTPDELRTYDERVASTLPADAAAWLENGRSVLDVEPAS